VERFDLAVIGAGAAGLFCAGIAGQRGLKVLVLDHAQRLGEKIRISGGGRCNFTNLGGADETRYLSQDGRFARHALRAYPPQRFIDLVRSHRIGFHEKHRGQLFCDDSSQRIIGLLDAECRTGGVTIRHPVRVRAIEYQAAGPRRFTILSDQGSVAVANLVLATGGLSIPAIGASDFAWRQAAQWGLETVEAMPGLVPLTFPAARWQPFVGVAGVSAPVAISLSAAARSQATASPAGAQDPQGPAAARRQGSRPVSLRQVSFEEDLLFTHRGLSGPAILQISSYWRPGQRLEIDLLPGVDLAQRLIGIKEGSLAVEGGEGHRQQLNTVLAAMLPRRLAQVWLAAAGAAALLALTGQERLAEIAHARLRSLAQAINAWQVEPAGSEGYKKAEVTLGGIATRELDPRNLQALRMPGLYCIGEAVDVTGWLGGYNFQWAWASAHAAAMSMAPPAPRGSSPAAPVA
jgi:predicted flavoprotein YhiN